MPHKCQTKIGDFGHSERGGAGSVNQTEIISDKCVYLKFLRGFSRPPPSNFSLTPSLCQVNFSTSFNFSNILQFKNVLISNQFEFQIDILKVFASLVTSVTPAPWLTLLFVWEKNCVNQVRIKLTSYFSITRDFKHCY